MTNPQRDINPRQGDAAPVDVRRHPAYPYPMPGRSISRKRLAERNLPHTVDILVPPLGLGRLLTEMLTWCRVEIAAGDWDHHGWSEPRGRKVIPRDFARFYFRHEGDADAFRRRWLAERDDQ